MHNGYDDKDTENAHGLTRYLLRQLSGAAENEHDPSERDLLRASVALNGGFSILDEWTVWAMRLPFVPTYCVPAYDGKTAVVVWQNESCWSAMLLPSMEVILEGALDIGEPVFAPGMCEPYLLYLTKDSWKLRLGQEEFALEAGPKDGGSGIEIARVINHGATRFVLLRNPPHTSWWFRLTPEMTAVLGAPTESEHHDPRIPVNEEYIASLPEGWNSFDDVVDGNGRVLGFVVTWENSGNGHSTLVPVSSVHDLTAGAIVGCWENVDIDELVDTPNGIIAFGGDKDDDFVGVSPCLVDGRDTMEGPEGYSCERAAGDDSGLLTWFGNGEVAYLTAYGEHWYKVHDGLCGVVPGAKGITGCVREEPGGQTSTVSLFVIPRPDPSVPQE